MNAITSKEISDRLAIRDLIDAYAHCADRRDAHEQLPKLLVLVDKAESALPYAARAMLCVLIDMVEARCSSNKSPFQNPPTSARRHMNEQAIAVSA